MSNALDALHSSASNEWYTPAHYTDAARAVMGGIDLDPASCAEANQTIQAARYYSKSDNGLLQRWHGRIWLNPPYGKQGNKSNQAVWSGKLIREFCGGNVEQAVLLVNACTGNKWFAPLWDFTVCFTDHRIRFIKPGGKRNQPTKDNAFIYFGPRVDDFARVFRAFGHIVKGGHSW